MLILRLPVRQIIFEEKIDDFTNAERILIVNYILNKTEISTTFSYKGIKYLIKRTIVKAAYPLHDSSSNWKNEGSLTETQVYLLLYII